MMYGGKKSEIPNLPDDACRLVRTRFVTDIATGGQPTPPLFPPTTVYPARGRSLRSHVSCQHAGGYGLTWPGCNVVTLGIRARHPTDEWCRVRLGLVSVIDHPGTQATVPAPVVPSASRHAPRSVGA